MAESRNRFGEFAAHFPTSTGRLSRTGTGIGTDETKHSEIRATGRYFILLGRFTRSNRGYVPVVWHATQVVKLS